MSAEIPFRRTLQPDGNRTLILSECARCGASRLVSAHNGSLREWEESHQCPAAAPAKKDPLPIRTPTRHASGE